MAQMTLFDSQVSEQLKVSGMDLAAGGKSAENLELARTIAKAIACHSGSVTADDVGIVLKRVHGIDSLGPAAGSIFKGEEWVFTGERVKSSRVSNHARELKIWRLRDVG